MVLAWAYVPHSIDEPIPAYYLASNSSYHAGNAFVSKLRGMGARTERSHVPVIPLLLNAKIGVMGRNGLLRLKGLGSRTVLTTFVTELCGPLEHGRAVRGMRMLFHVRARMPYGGDNRERS